MSDQAQTSAERADDYVLGLLSAAEMTAFEAEMETNGPLRTAVAASRDRFLELDLAGQTQSASPDLWSRIESSLGVQDAPTPAAARILPANANDNRLSRWKRAAFAGVAASAVLALALGYAIIDRPAPQVIAVLMDDKGAPLVLVEDFGNTHARITPLGDFTAPSDKSMQVWTLPNKEMGPTSLGLLDAWKTSNLDSRTLPQPHEEQLYEITLEQLGGSPTGRPTGPILVKGFARVPR
jgi:anti-sigma-K factor RskA